MIWIILIQLSSLVVNYFIAKYHTKLFSKNVRISHALWAAGFCLLYAPTILISWWLFISILIIRLPFFNITLNYLREKPIFYYGKESVIDRYVGKYYPQIYVGCALAFWGIEFHLFN